MHLGLFLSIKTFFEVLCEERLCQGPTYWYSYKTSSHKTSSSSKRPSYKTSFHKTSRLQNVHGYKTSSPTKCPVMGEGGTVEGWVWPHGAKPNLRHINFFDICLVQHILFIFSTFYSILLLLLLLLLLLHF
jgi:hypothetical protein